MTQDTRARILEAALSLFLERGMAATRIGEIRERAGVSNGSLFHFFPTKEAIGVALYVDSILSYQGTLIAQLGIADRAPAETIGALVQAHWSWVEAERDRARFLFLQGPPGWHPDAESQVRQQNGRAQQAVADWLAAAPQRAVLRPIPPEIFIPLILGASMMATRLWLRGLAGAPPPEYIAHFAEAAIHSLLKDTSQ